ncbi:MAG: ABC transporter permease [Micromonosporaceae bacterium]
MISRLAERKTDRIDSLAEASAKGGGTSLLVDAVRRLVRSPVAIIGGMIIFGFLLLALFAPLLAQHDPTVSFDELKEELRADFIPGAKEGFLLGSDQFGRDFYSRMLYASRQTLFVGVVATMIGLLVGMVIGGISGAFGGWVDALLMRLTDVMLAMPSLLLAISLVALARKPGQWTVILAVATVAVPIFARLLRGSMLAQRESDHVLAARALGVRRHTIVLRHMLPNSLSPVLVQATLTLAVAILDAAALSFLGLGDQDTNRAEWGLMLGEAQRYLDVRPALAMYPAFAIIVVALGFTLLGESMREALDPKNRR